MTSRSRVRSVTPLFLVSDLQRSIDFYCQKLGYAEPAVHGDPPCFAMMNRDGFDLMLSLADDSAQVRPNGPTGTLDMYVSVADIAGEIAALERAGVKLDKGPSDTFYEMREIEIIDPDGHRICFAQDIRNEPLRSADVWEGVLDVGAAKLRLVLKLVATGHGLLGRLDSLDQGAMNLPLDQVKRAGQSLSFELKSAGATYEGTLNGDSTELAGRWSQGGRTWPLVFRRV
jgi:catechol 2,3-dioxygenase-like lactoylglutathione lyase family enzyme